MEMHVQIPVAGLLAVYQGTYRPHWEIGHVEVRVPFKKRRILGLVTGICVVISIALAWVNIACAAALGTIASFGLLHYFVSPSVERWSVSFPRENWVEEFPNGMIGVGAGPIEFEAVVSEPGHYGHKGIMNRIATIHRIVKCRRAKSADHIL